MAMHIIGTEEVQAVTHVTRPVEQMAKILKESVINVNVMYQIRWKVSITIIMTYIIIQIAKDRSYFKMI